MRQILWWACSYACFNIWLQGMLCTTAWHRLGSRWEKVSQVGCCHAQTDAHWVTTSRARRQDREAPSCLTCGMLHSFLKWTHQHTQAQHTAAASWQVTWNRQCLPGTFVCLLLSKPFAVPDSVRQPSFVRPSFWWVVLLGWEQDPDGGHAMKEHESVWTSLKKGLPFDQRSNKKCNEHRESSAKSRITGLITWL